MMNRMSNVYVQSAAPAYYWQSVGLPLLYPFSE